MPEDIGVTSVTFFFPSHLIGGTEYLFVRFAKELFRMGYTVYVVDFRDGFLSHELKNTDIHLIPYTVEENILLPPNTCLILTAMLNYSFIKLVLDESSKILIYCMHQYSLITRFYTSDNLQFKDDPEVLKRKALQNYPKRFETIQQNLLTLHQKHGFVYMDYHNLLINRDFFDLPIAEESFESIICPIPCPDTLLQNIIDIDVPLVPHEIRLGCLGRLAPEKIHGIRYIIQNLERYLQETGDTRTVKLYIIGEGMSRILLETLPHIPQIDLIFVGHLINEELDYFMKHNLDTLFAMGTSLIEGSKLKIPTVVTDSSFVPIDINYKMSWFFELPDYALGGSVGKTGIDHKHTMKSILNAIYEQGFKKEYGERCYQKFLRNHTVHGSTYRLMKQIQRSEVWLPDFVQNNFYINNANG